MLLACALYPLQDAELERLQTLCSPAIDWAAFAALVDRHRLIPTVYRNLSSHAATLVPSAALAGFKEQAESNRQRILQILAELGRIGRQFNQAGIPVCALKGPLLAQRLYGDASLRTSRDLDLLIRPGAVTRAEALLLDHGNERSFPSKPLTPRQWRIYQREWRHFIYFHPEPGTYVELHWAIAPPSLVPMQVVDQMLANSRPMALAGANVLTLADEDLPVYLLVHGSVHSWVRLKWLVDFAIWMRQADSPDWLELRARMATLGLQRSLAQGVLLAHWLFSAPIPEPVEPLLVAEPRAQRMATHSLKAILNPSYTGAEEGQFQRLKVLLYRTNLKKDLRYKWATLSKIAIIPNDWLDLPLPDALFPLYWLLRPFLWLQRYHLRRCRRPVTAPPET